MSTPQEQRGDVVDNTRQPVTSTSAQSQPPEIYRVGVKPPAFCKEQPDLFFTQLESKFALAGITSDATKYHHVIASLEPQHFIHIDDIMRDPSVINKYGAIKDALIKEYTDSDERKLNKLIHEMQLGDLKPSQLLKRARKLAHNNVSEKVIKTLWLEKLPDNVRAIASIIDGDLTKVSLAADKVMEAQTKPSISAAHEANNDLLAEIDALRKEIKQMKSNTSTKDRSNNISKSSSPFCYYHARFGAKAKKCVEPCEFQKLAAKN